MYAFFGRSPSNTVGGKDPPQLGLFERRGSLRKPLAPDATKEEPFKRSWSFRIGGGGFKTKDVSPGGNDSSAFLRMFRFGEDKKKGSHQEPGRRRMSDAAVTKAARKEELSQCPACQRVARSKTSPGGHSRHAGAHVAALSGGRSLSSCGRTRCRSFWRLPPVAANGGDTNAIRGLIYGDLKAEVNGDLIRIPRTKSSRNHESRSGKVSDAVLPHFLSPGHNLCGGDPERENEKRALKKLLFKRNVPCDGCRSPSNTVGGKDPPQLGLFERRGSLRKPLAPDATKEEPFKRSWSFRIGGGGFKTKDVSPGGNDSSAFLRMFRFGEDKKKGSHQEPGRRRMSDAAVTKAARKEELSQCPACQRVARSKTSPGGHSRHAGAHVAALSGGRSLSSCGRTRCRSFWRLPPVAANGGDTNAIRGLIYGDLKAEVNGDLIRIPRTKSSRNHESRSGKVSDAVLPHFLSPGHNLCGGDPERENEKRALKKLLFKRNVPCDGCVERKRRRRPLRRLRVRRVGGHVRRLWPNVGR
ncbi:hypothetical protein HPB52_023886 [Rhipicephalus sanguineus]|uniref:Uncharacterized protein n=1 Tax=Rhipicephalus sanguineus TaxID=34632 RepID=A0A9D4TC75_RHISA|nr:hypothetical protein HPB52_023886 [Rhipicephalus sanguineus]